jgi:hypothetical protein
MTNMNIEQQVISLDIAKRLKELGVGQESTFLWIVSSHGDKWVSFNNDDLPKILIRDKGEWFSALTSAELGELLPYYFSSEKHSNDWRAGFANPQETRYEKLGFFSAATEADARGKMLIYLLENKIA